MTDSDERSVSVSRRQFLAGVGATSAGAAAIGSAATDDPTLALGSTEPMPINSRFNIDDYRIGPKSERPAAADVKGTVYEVTDNNASNGTTRTVSDGSQWVTLNVEADVIDTEELSDSISFLDPNGTVSDWQTTIDDLSASGGGTVVPRPGQYDISDAAPSIKDNVALDGLWWGAVTFRLVNDAPGTAPPPVLLIENGVSNAAIRNVEVDGNQANNTDAFGGSNESHGIEIEDTDNNNRPENCTVENVYIHDTIRSNLVMSGRNCEARNLWLSNAATDHWIYLARGIGCHIENVHASGFAKSGGIVFGGNSLDTFDNKVENVVMEDLAATPQNNDLVSSVEFRNGTGIHRNNTVENLTVGSTGYSAGAQVLFNHPQCRVIGYDFHGPSDATHHLNLAQSADNATVENADIEITNTTLTTGYAARLRGTNQSVDVRLRETGSTSAYRGMLLIGDQETVSNPSLSGHLAGGNTAGIRIAGSTNGVRRVAADDLVIDHGTKIDGSGTYTFASGTMLPQNVLNINAPHDGYLAHHDGTDSVNVNDIEPAYYQATAAEWRGLYSGTVIA